jgi:hypothetical protein
MNGFRSNNSVQGHPSAGKNIFGNWDRNSAIHQLKWWFTPNNMMDMVG